MIQKPKIQYVGQFYIHGSEARQPEVQPEPRKKAKTRLPIAQLERIEKIYVDPVALVGIAVAVVMLVVMVVGALQLKEDWAAYDVMANYVSRLKLENAQLNHDYRHNPSYNLEEIQSKATALGMVPKTELQTRTVAVSMPLPVAEPTWEEELRWFWEGLWE